MVRKNEFWEKSRREFWQLRSVRFQCQEKNPLVCYQDISRRYRLVDWHIFSLLVLEETRFESRETFSLVSLSWHKTYNGSASLATVVGFFQLTDARSEVLADVFTRFFRTLVVKKTVEYDQISVLNGFNGQFSLSVPLRGEIMFFLGTNALVKVKHCLLLESLIELTKPCFGRLFVWIARKSIFDCWFRVF